MAIHFNHNGKHYDSIKDWKRDAQNDPTCETVFWEYLSNANCNLSKDGSIYDGGHGKCIYKGRTFEGEVQTIDGHLYVGGVLVK